MPRAFLIKKQHVLRKNMTKIDGDTTTTTTSDNEDFKTSTEYSPITKEHDRKEMESLVQTQDTTVNKIAGRDLRLRTLSPQAVTPMERRPSTGTVSPLPGPDCPKPSSPPSKRLRIGGEGELTEEVSPYRPWTTANVPRFFHPAFSPTMSTPPPRVAFPPTILPFPPPAQYACHGYDDPFRSLMLSRPLLGGAGHDRSLEFHRLPATPCQQQRSPGKPTDFEFADADYRCIVAAGTKQQQQQQQQRPSSGPPRFQCDACNKSYSTVNGLSKHREFHCASQVKKEFGCKHCAKTYTSLGALKMHIRTHTLPCKCKLCGKAFSRPWLLQGHLRTHTGEKPFECAHCGRAFADRSNLRAHLQTHSDVKKYNCDTCAKTFSRMSLLLKHRDGGCMGIIDIL